MHEYHRVLSNLTEITSRHANRSDDSDDSGEEEVLSPKKSEVEARRESKKEKREKKEEKKRLKKKAKEEAKEKEREAAKPKLATHSGRFKKREMAKNVRGYSTEDLTAILGGTDPFASVAISVAASAPPPEKKARRNASSSPPKSPSSQESEVTAPGPTPPRPRSAAARPAPAVAPEDAEAWWAAAFHRAGRLGAGRAARAGKRGFNEADQESLYMRAHGKATHGHQGLGIGSAPKKVAGARWEGTKTKLESDDEDDDAEGEGEEGELGLPQPELPELTEIEIVMPKKWQAARAAERASGSSGAADEARPKAAAGSGASSESGAGPDDALSGLKWKRLAVAVLADSGKSRMRTKKLVAAVLDRGQVPEGRRATVSARLAETLSASSRFVVKDGKVSLPA